MVACTNKHPAYQQEKHARSQKCQIVNLFVDRIFHHVMELENMVIDRAFHQIEQAPTGEPCADQYSPGPNNIFSFCRPE